MSKTIKIKTGRQIAQVLGLLSEKNREILERRFGIGKDEAETLESIGRSYNITRERVRQIQEYGLKKLNSDSSRGVLAPTFSAVEAYIHSKSGVASEEDLFDGLVSSSEKPHRDLALRLMPNIFYSPETDDLKSRYSLDKKYLNSVDSFLNKFHTSVAKSGSPMSFKELISIAEGDMPSELHGANLEHLLSLSRSVQSGPFGEYGLSDWAAIRPRGVRDKAHLVFNKEKKPLHFKELSTLIDRHFRDTSFSRATHPQTVHNELIKDNRFVLIGRGLYALREWGYEEGTVKDVLVQIFKENSGALDKEKVLDLVLKRRYVKPNTVLLNLQNKKYFKKELGGKYYLA